MHICTVSCSLVAFGLLSILQVDPSRAANATLWVANDGTDSGSCGGQSSPCYNPGPSAHCGVLNLGALNGPDAGMPAVAITLTATGNFWGSAKGPAAAGPGDAAGGACDQNDATTIFKPFATAFL